MATDQGRLEQLYAEMGDEHLLDMADDMDDLTDEGRIALTAELRKRGILPEPPNPQTIVPEVEPQLEQGFGAGMPGIFPGGASMMEQVLEPAEPSADPKDGMSRLISFYDGLELSKACGFLEDSEIEPVIEPIAGDALSGVAPRFEIWLETAEIEPAKTLLRAKMGLFPLAEVDEEDEGSDEVESEVDELVVAEFDSAAEAEAAKAILTEAGIAARIDADDTDSTLSAVVVPVQEQERALELLAEKMGLG
jgi:hypothetical protein